MLKKAVRIIKTKGMGGLVSAVSSKIYTGPIKNFRVYAEHLKEKKGIEIGGPSALFKKGGLLPLYPLVANLDGCNFSNSTMWEGNIQEGLTYNYHETRNGRQFICDAVDLTQIPSGTYDFVISCHAIEHVANTLKAISEWIRVLKEDGILLLVVPHKDGSFDHNRPITAFSHLVQDLENNIKENDLTHLEEVLQLHDLALDPPAGDFESFKKRSQDNYMNRGIHQHVFNTELVIKIFDYFNLQILSVDVAQPHHIIVMGKKTATKKGVNNDAFLCENAAYKRSSPFPSDQL